MTQGTQGPVQYREHQEATKGCRESVWGWQGCHGV